VCFPTWDSAHVDDVIEAGFDPVGRRVSKLELREALRRRLAVQVRPRDQIMSMIVGDFNFMASEADRTCKSSAAAAGGRDYRDSSRWRDLLGVPFGFHEVYQPEPTSASPNPQSRLDRACSNQCDTEYMDKSFS
ncbi:unnamed protein product, partial [Prorocentrum cordatum]